MRGRKAAVLDAVRGAHAWAYMRRDPDYRRDWAAHAAPPRFETAGFPLRVQTESDLLAEADWALLAWEDPGAEAWRSPFWSGIAMLVGEPDPDPLDPERLSVEIAGELVTWIGREESSREDRRYRLAFRVDAGRIGLLRFEQMETGK